MKIDASLNRNEQARQVVRAAAKSCHTPEGFDQTKFEGLMVHLLSSVLENEWVDEQLESNIRLLWAELVGAEVINDSTLEE